MVKYLKYILFFSFVSTLLYAEPPEVQSSKCIYCDDYSCSDFGPVENQVEKDFCNSLDEEDTYVFTNSLVPAGKKCIVYKFSATWCGPCKLLAPHIDKLKGDFSSTTFNDYDVDKTSDEFKKKYNVSSIPKIIAWVKGDDGKYKQIFNQTGLKESSAEKTADALKKALNDAGCGPSKSSLDDTPLETDISIDSYDSSEDYYNESYVSNPTEEYYYDSLDFY